MTNNSNNLTSELKLKPHNCNSNILINCINANYSKLPIAGHKICSQQDIEIKPAKIIPLNKSSILHKENTINSLHKLSTSHKMNTINSHKLKQCRKYMNKCIKTQVKRVHIKKMIPT